MRDDAVGKRLIAELLDDPREFFESGKAYELLQEFFGGLALDTLRPLLQANDQYIRRTALWVTSELGSGGCNLIDEVLQVVDDPDRYTRYHVLEIITVCAHGEKVGAFMHVARSLESDDEVLRAKAMRLVSNADVAQLKAAVESIDLSRVSDRPHAKGLLELSGSELLDERDVVKMLDDANPIIRKYGAMAAKRLRQKFPALIARATESADPDIRNFAQI